MHAYFADTPLPGLPVDWPGLLVGGGTVGLITGLVILVGLLVTRRLRTGGETEEWRETATKNTATLATLVPAIEKIAETVDRLVTVVEALHHDQELRQVVEDERRRERRG